MLVFVWMIHDSFKKRLLLNRKQSLYCVDHKTKQYKIKRIQWLDTIIFQEQLLSLKIFYYHSYWSIYFWIKDILFNLASFNVIEDISIGLGGRGVISVKFVLSEWLDNHLSSIHQTKCIQSNYRIEIFNSVWAIQRKRLLNSIRHADTNAILLFIVIRNNILLYDALWGRTGRFRGQTKSDYWIVFIKYVWTAPFQLVLIS